MKFEGGRGPRPPRPPMGEWPHERGSAMAARWGLHGRRRPLLLFLLELERRWRPGHHAREPSGPQHGGVVDVRWLADALLFLSADGISCDRRGISKKIKHLHKGEGKKKNQKKKKKYLTEH
jgi:hypothetical protein